MNGNSDDTNNLLKGILLALALKEEKRENQVKILKAGGLSQIKVIELIGISETTERTRKHKQKKKNSILSKKGGGIKDGKEKSDRKVRD